MGCALTAAQNEIVLLALNNNRMLIAATVCAVVAALAISLLAGFAVAAAPFRALLRVGEPPHGYTLRISGAGAHTRSGRLPTRNSARLSPSPCVVKHGPPMAPHRRVKWPSNEVRWACPFATVLKPCQ